MQELALELPEKDFTDVASNRESFENFEKRISALEGHGPLILQDKNLNPPAFRTLINWLKKPPAALAVWLPLLGAVLYMGKLILDSHIRAQLAPVQTQINSLNKTVSEIKGEMNVLIPTSLKRISQLSPKQLANALPDLHRLLSSPASAAALTRDTADKLAANLSQVPKSAPNYWITVITFIQIASNGLSRDVPPAGKPTLIFRSSEIIGPAFGIISHRVVELDGGELVNQRFEHCRIIFTSHPVKMANVLFLDCAFQIPQEPHNEYIKSVAGQLLASNLSKIHQSS